MSVPLTSATGSAQNGSREEALSNGEVKELRNRLGQFAKYWQWVSVILLGLAVGGLLTLIYSSQYRNYSKTAHWDLWLQMLVQSLLVLTGIRTINRRLDQTYPWINNLKQRLARQAISNLGFVVIISLLYQSAFGAIRFYFLDHKFIALQDEAITTTIFISLSFVVVLVDWGIFLLGSLRSAEAQSERYRKERIEFQFEMLRNQVNPHFLFNNLNTIGSLVHNQPDVAAEFVRQLSKVYRYLLEYQNREMINLSEEEEFLKSYLYLISMRFGQNVRIDLDLPERYKSYQIVPVCLQMLVENALKHNIASKSKPLSIAIRIDNSTDEVVISNNVQAKNSTEFSSRIGLANIKSRYQFLTSRKVTIDHQPTSFTVKLPLLHPYESTNRGR